MCLIENFTDVYPQETRTKQVIRRCFLSPRKGTCRCTLVCDHSEVYHIRRNQPEDRGRMTRSSLDYYPEPARPRGRSNPAIGRRPSLKRSNSFKLFCMPFFRRTYKHDNDQDSQRRREEEKERYRVRRTFVVDPPETRRYAHPRIETVSPPRGRSPASDRWRQHTPGDSEIPSQNSQGHQPHRKPRAPRKRTPVSDRVPQRRNRSSPPRVVEIRNPRPEYYETSQTRARPRYEERSPHTRRVRFSGDIGYEKNSNRAARNEGNYIRVEEQAQGRASRRDSFNDNRGHEYEIFDKRTNRRYHLQEREPSPWPRRQRGIHRTGTAPIINHIRPRIIREGHQQMSRAGERICLESRGGPVHAGNIYNKDHRRYRWRWS